MDWSPLQQILREWYFENRRDLPWRKTNDAYTIWLSEIILQQTQVEQGRPYFERFIKRFPKLIDLAQAPQDEVLRLWEGLGYYSRARNLHEAAKMVVSEFEGDFPEHYEDIKSLKGVGDYTAAAIASFAYKLPYAVVDGNVYRFLSRLRAESTPINSSEGKKVFQALADDFLDPKNPDTHNQAIMEFGALQCVPRKPNCEICPFKEHCLGYIRNIHIELPLKIKKKYDQKRYLNYWFFQSEQETWLEKRSAGIWKGLYQFPMYESQSELKADDLATVLPVNISIEHGKRVLVHRLPKHKLSHQTLFISLWELPLKASGPRPLGEALKKVAIKDLKDFALPRPLRKFLDENQLTLPLE